MTITLGGLYVVFKKLISLISAIMILIVGASEKDLPSPTGAEVMNVIRYVLTDKNYNNQGITNDGEYFYFSGTKNMAKADIKTGEIFCVTMNAIPDELEEKGCNHIGGISYHDGIVYAAIEDGPDYLNSFIALYDAETLEYTGVYYELPHELHIEGVPWCAIDAELGYLYTAEWSNATVLNVFKLDDMSLVKTVELSEPIDRIQGAEMYDGKLYMSCDEENDKKRVLSLDPVTGKVETVFERNIGKAFEAEGITVYEDENGEPVFCVLDRGAERYSTNLTFYKLTK